MLLRGNGLVQQSRNGRVERQRTAWRKFRWLCTLQPMFGPLTFRRGHSALALSLCLAGCTGSPPPGGPAPVGPPPTSERGSDRLPPVAPVTGPLRLSVAYPVPTDLIDARDSTFILGSVGTGIATLTVNQVPVPVAPNGAWIAWLPIPPDSVISFTITARTATDSATLVY